MSEIINTQTNNNGTRKWGIRILIFTFIILIITSYILPESLHISIREEYNTYIINFERLFLLFGLFLVLISFVKNRPKNFHKNITFIGFTVIFGLQLSSIDFGIFETTLAEYYKPVALGIIGLFYGLILRQLSKDKSLKSDILLGSLGIFFSGILLSIWFYLWRDFHW